MARRHGKRDKRRMVRRSRNARADPGDSPPPKAAARPRTWAFLVVLLAAGVSLTVVRFTAHDATDEGKVGRGLASRDDQIPREERAVERLRVRVIHRYPHRKDAFTQGLVWHDGSIYESTGREGHSSLRMVELETGDVLRRRDNEPRQFAEGLALVGDVLYQLTWRSGRVLLFRRDDFAPVGEHSYDGEGWGLCYDGANLVMSDGSDRLVFRDPDSFAERHAVRVTLQGKPVDQLNELECVTGSVWANVWKQPVIIRIDPRNGRVTAVVDASGLLTPEESRASEVLNGIAWIPERGHFLLTGKHWPWMFEVVFDRASLAPSL